MPRSEFKTQKGTVLPLMNLKGKEYLMVAHRLVWLTEEAESYEIVTEFPVMLEEQAVAKTTLTIFDKEGKVLKKTQATKRETKKDFPDFIEKAETGSLGRALAMAGFGTQFSTQDLDEGDRLADAPLAEPKVETAEKKELKEKQSFRKSKVEKKEATTNEEESW
jgi:hypothetical protein